MSAALSLGIRLSLLAFIVVIVVALCEVIWPYQDDPSAKAYTGILILTVIAKAWNFIAATFNIFIGILQPLVPAWNALSQYVVQPIVFISLEIISLILPPFGNPDVFFVLNNDDFKGYDCYATLKDNYGIDTEKARVEFDPDQLSAEERAKTSMAWCGILGYYQMGQTGVVHARQLAQELSARVPGVSELVHPRTMEDARRIRAVANHTIPLPLDTVKRVTKARMRSLLEEAALTDFKDFVLDTDSVFTEVTKILRITAHDLASVVSTISGFFIYLLGALADIVFHIIYVILDEIITTVADLIILFVRTIAELIMSLVQSGALGTILTFALDIITILLLDIALPLFTLFMNSLECVFHLLDTSAWSAELTCVENHCFQKGGPSDLIVFLDGYAILDFVYKIIRDTFDSGARLFGAQGFQLPVLPAWQTSEAQALNKTSGCAACFKCKVPELRFVNYIIMTMLSCYSPTQINRYSYNVLERCVPNGSFYIDFCDGDLNATRPGPNALGAYDPQLINEWANRFKKLSHQLGGESTIDGKHASEMAAAWLSEGTSADETDMRDAARQMFKRACFYQSLNVVRTPKDQNMDERYPWYVGSDFYKYAYNPFMHEVSEFMYSMCSDSSFDVCYVDFFKWTISSGNDLSDCLKEMPECIKQRELCLGRCGSSGPDQDFFTSASKAMLHLGRPDYIALCQEHVLEYEIMLFGERGENLRKFAEEMQTRNGLTAFDPSTVSPDVVKAIQSSIENNNGLAYVPGRGIVLSSDVSPPSPPPWDGRMQNTHLVRNSIRLQLPAPPSPPPSPNPPPAWCGDGWGIPMQSMKHFKDVYQLRDYDGSVQRDVCFFSRRVLDESMAADRCFAEANIPSDEIEAELANAPPMPPSLQEVIDRTLNPSRHPPPPPKLAYDPSFVTLKENLQSGLTGRRLELYDDAFVQSKVNIRFKDAVIGRVKGTLTSIECGELCLRSSECYAFSTRDNYASDERGECVLLRHMGKCTLRDFATQLSTLPLLSWRSVYGQSSLLPKSGERCTFQSSRRCLQLPTTLPPDLNRVINQQQALEATITYKDARTICDQRTRANYIHSENGMNSKLGTLGLPNPQNDLEAYTAIAYAREEGVSAFFVHRPFGGRASSHWPWMQIGGLGKIDDGTQDGCAIVYSPKSTLYMSATIVPCDAPMATGVVCFTSQIGLPTPTTTRARVPPPPPSPPSPPPNPPHDTQDQLITGQKSVFSGSRVRSLTAAVCTLQSSYSIRSRCDEFISSLFPLQAIGSVPESPLCGDLYWQWHDHSEESEEQLIGRASMSVGGSFCWPSCQQFRQYPDASVARSGCLAFVRMECPTPQVSQAQRACATHLRSSPPPPPTIAP